MPAAFPAAVAVQTLRTVAVAAAAYAAFTPAASAGEYVWLPRRHHRRMDEWERTIPAVERVKVRVPPPHPPPHFRAPPLCLSLLPLSTLMPLPARMSA